MEPASVRRSRFGHSEAAVIGEADGLPVRAAQLRVRAMNFNQHWQTPGVREVRYRIVLPQTFITDLLSREWPDYVADGQAFPSDDALSVALAQRGWPDVEQVLAEPTLCALACNWFAHDFILGWLADGAMSEQPGYVLNTVEFLAHEGAVLAFTGTARTADQTVQYQDV